MSESNENVNMTSQQTSQVTDSVPSQSSEEVRLEDQQGTSSSFLQTSNMQSPGQQITRQRASTQQTTNSQRATQQANSIQQPALQVSDCQQPTDQSNQQSALQAVPDSGKKASGPNPGKSKKKQPSASVEMQKSNQKLAEMDEQLSLLKKQIEIAKSQLQLQQLTGNMMQLPNAQPLLAASQPSVTESQTNQPPTSAANSIQPLVGTNPVAGNSSGLFASTQFLAATNLYKVYGFKGKTPEEVDTWFRELNNLKDQLKTSDDEILRMFGQWITNDDLVRWWRQIAPEIKTLAEAQKELRIVCGDNTPPHIALMKALRVHQKWEEKVDKYILGQRELLSRVYPRFTDQQLPVLLWQGLSHAIKAEMKMKSGMSMPEFLEECRSAEAVARAKQGNSHKRFKNGKESEDHSKWCENCNSKTHNTADCWSKKKNPNTKRSNKRSVEVDDKESEPKKSKIECYICKGPHLASQCTSK